MDYSSEDFAQKYKDAPFDLIVDLQGGKTLSCMTLMHRTHVLGRCSAGDSSLGPHLPASHFHEPTSVLMPSAALDQG